MRDEIEMFWPLDKARDTSRSTCPWLRKGNVRGGTSGPSPGSVQEKHANTNKNLPGSKKEEEHGGRPMKGRRD